MGPTDAGSSLSHLTLTDLVVLVVLVLAVTGALRRGRGLLGAAASLVVTALVAWLAVSALATWGPARVQDDVRRSTLLAVAPAPTHALHEAGRLVGHRP